MSVSTMYALGVITIATSAAIVVVALVRKPLRHFAGSQVAYWLWLLVPASALVVLLPAPSQKLQIATQTVPQLILSAFPLAISSGNAPGVASHLPMIGLVIWVAGSLLMLALVAHRQRVFMHTLRGMSSAPDGTYRSAAVASPTLVGIRRPRIVLPLDFDTLYSSQERALVLAHEEAHRRRGDIFINGIATIWLSLFWFNPLVYWAIARLRFDQELACDAAVLRESISERRCYARALMKAQFAEDSAWLMPVGCHWQSSHPLKERIAMLSQASPNFVRRMSGVVLTSALIFSGSYAVWAAQPSAPYARYVTEQGKEDPTVKISARQISTTLDGAADLSEDVIIESMDADTPLQMTFTANFIMSQMPSGPTVLKGAVVLSQMPSSPTVLEGAVVISFADIVVTTDRAIVENERTIRMDSAHISSAVQRQ